jgi:TRAP-type C4-dicarboxylate transport system permease small subunit
MSIFAFGLFLVYQGWGFAILMSESTLPATKLPTSVQYLIIPIAGVMICAYAVLQLFNINTNRHQNIEEGN